MRRTTARGGTVIFGGDLGRYSRPMLPDPSAGSRPTCCWSNPPTAIASTRPTTGASAGGDHQRHRRRTRQADHSRRSPSAASRRCCTAIKKLEDAGNDPALPVYVDSPMALRRSSTTSGTLASSTTTSPCGAGKCAAFCTARFTPVASAQESQEVVERVGPGHRHLGEWHGHRRASAAPPGQRAARSPEYRALRRFPGGRHPRAPADRRRPGGEDPRAVGSRARAGSTS